MKAKFFNILFVAVLMVVLVGSVGCRNVSISIPSTYSTRSTVIEKPPVLREAARGEMISRTLHTGSHEFPHVEDTGVMRYEYSVWRYDELRTKSK